MIQLRNLLSEREEMIELSSKRQLIDFKTWKMKKFDQDEKRKSNDERKNASSHQKNDEEHFK